MATVRFAVLFFLTFAIACGGKAPTVPDTASLRFTARAAEPGTPESVTAEGGSGQVAIRATLLGPDPCRTLDAQLDHADGEMTLRVFIRPNDAGVCVLVIGRFAYDAVIDGLPRGRYALKVIHTYPSTGWPAQTPLSQTVDVR